MSQVEVTMGEVPIKAYKLNSIKYYQNVSVAYDTWVNTNQNAEDFILIEVVYPPNPLYYLTATLRDGVITSKFSTDLDIRVNNGKIEIKQLATNSTQSFLFRGFA